MRTVDARFAFRRFGVRMAAAIAFRAAAPLALGRFAMGTDAATAIAAAAPAAAAAMLARRFLGFRRLFGGDVPAGLPFDLLTDQFLDLVDRARVGPETIVTATPSLPARPVRPMRWT